MGVVVKPLSSWMSRQGSFHWATTPRRECQRCDQTSGTWLMWCLLASPRAWNFLTGIQFTANAEKVPKELFLWEPKYSCWKVSTPALFVSLGQVRPWFGFMQPCRYSWVADLADREVVLKHTQKAKKQNHPDANDLFTSAFFCCYLL